MRALLRPAAALLALLALSAAALAPALRAGETTKAAPVPPVVSGEWLEPRLAARDLALLDARPLKDFVGAHLPGAQSVSPENLRSTSGGVPATTYPADLLGAVFARAGVVPDRHVVVYGAESDPDATYVATAARIAGAGAVSVLDGGFSRWNKDLRPVTGERLRVPAVKPELKGDASLLVPLEAVAKSVGDGKTVFLDVRSEEAWAAGHIPGAKSRFWKADVADGVFRPNDALRAELEAAGVSWEKPVVVYCNSGHQASEGFYLLKYVLAHPDVRLYQGSWLEWSMTPGTPRESSTPASPSAPPAK